MGNDKKLISIIIPCRNENKYIGQVLEDILNQDYPKENIEVFVIDGMSYDGTRDIINEFSKKFHWIKTIDNPNKTAPYALNIGINNSKGHFLRMDAHSSYPPNYISSLFAWMNKLNADNVGCPVITLPTDSSKKAIAIANVLSHPFGVGNAHFRLGTDEPREVDTVMFGFYRREVFSKIGYFDEDLTRNQDDEFNARLKRAGGKIFLVPGLNFKYYARNSFSKLLNMYFQYGYFKPLVNTKIMRPSNLRQLVPGLFLLSLISTLVFGIFSPDLFKIFLIILSIYLLVNTIFSTRLSKGNGPIQVILNMTGFMILHFSYGLGYLKGMLDFVVFRKKSKLISENISISR